MAAQNVTNSHLVKVDRQAIKKASLGTSLVVQ